MFSIGFLTLDIIIVLILAIILFFISLSKGEYVLARFLLSFYPTTLIFENLPYFTLSTAFSKIVAYAVIMVVFYLLLSKNFTARRSYNKRKKTFDGIILSLASVTTLLTIYYQILPLENVYKFTLPVETFFVSVIPYGIWLIIPIIALVITNKGHR